MMQRHCSFTPTEGTERRLYTDPLPYTPRARYDAESRLVRRLKARVAR